MKKPTKGRAGIPAVMQNNASEKAWKSEVAKKGRKKFKTSNYTHKSDRFTALKVIDQVNDLLWKVFDYQTDRLINQTARYNDGVAHKLHYITKLRPSKCRTERFRENNRCCHLFFAES